ncbi:MAG: ATP-binding protein [Bacillota bacterium]|nr:ATP-binding protein [Bacillota bacterium]
MIIRKIYLDKLINYRDTKVIKVITGIRRSGKSILLDQFYEYLIDSGIEERQIVKINFESIKYDAITDYKNLYEYVESKIIKNKKIYILLDEIQKVVEWEKALTSFQVDYDCDIYITGSNAYLLSSELATYLSGRYIEIHILPFSFREFVEIENEKQREKLFDLYLKQGGFPGLYEFSIVENAKKDYLEGIYNTIVVKDIIERSKVTDVDLMRRILRYLIDNTGNLVSANKISNFLKSSGRKTTTKTVIDYLTAFENAFILYKVKRYKIKGKQILNSPDKYYVVDLGLRRMIHGFESFDIGRALENIVYLELVRRGYQIYVGADDNFEVDFIAMKEEEKVYYQVSLSIVDEKVKEREVKGLLSIKDNYKKVLLTMDYSSNELIEGIEQINIVDFLLE